MRRTLLVGALALAGCAPLTRVRRAFAPSDYLVPAASTGALADVTVDSGWKDEAPFAYAPQPEVVRDGTSWVGPVDVTDRGAVRISARRPDAEVAVYARHGGLAPRGFRPVLERAGTLPGELETALRFWPSGPLGDRAVDLAIEDLADVYNAEPVADGDLVLVEVSAPGVPPERYLFRVQDFGVRVRGGAGVLVRLPIPWVEDQRGASLSPALTASAFVNWRWRTRAPVVSWLGEQLALVGSVGIGSTELEDPGELFGGGNAFDAALVGGGIEVLQFASVQVLANASAPFRDDREAGYALAVGFDAVQFARFTAGLGERPVREHPMLEDEP